VLGVFITPGWGIVLGAGTTVTGMIITQAGNAWNTHVAANTRREDRQHERALDYENWARQAKSDALMRLISACRFVKWQAQLTGAENTDENYRRAATIRALDLFREKIGGEDGISEITAYAAEPVREALDEMLEAINAQRRQHIGPLWQLQLVGRQLDAAIKEEPLKDASGAPVADVQQLLQQRASLLRSRQIALDHIGDKSDLDVDGVIALCDRAIDVAQKDLKGRYTE
jgi:hypothetical protein